MASISGTYFWDDYTIEHYLLKYTIQILRERCEKLLSIFRAEGDNPDATEDKKPGIEINKHDCIKRELNCLNVAERELDLINEIISTSDKMETAIAASKFRLERLQEEHDWLQEEERYFTTKMEQETLNCDRLRKTISHVAYLFNGRRDFNGYSLPTSIYGLPSDETNQVSMAQSYFDKIDPISLKSTHKYKTTESFFSETPTTKEMENFTNTNMKNSEQTNRGQLATKSTPKDISNANASNSGMMSLQELKKIMLEETEEDHKKGKHVRKRSKVTELKTKSHLNDKLIVPVLSESDKLMITEYLRNKVPSIYGDDKEDIDNGFEQLEKIIENFIRSPNRSDNMNNLIQLINHFTYQELYSPGISLCWMVILKLRIYEKELRQMICPRKKDSEQKLCTSKLTSIDNEYEHVIEDIGRLLTLIGLHHKSKNEFTQAIECFKQIIKIRSLSKSMLESSMANTFHHLSVVQALANNHSAAIVSARKAIRLRKELLASSVLMLDSATEQLAIARENTHLSLLIMHRHLNEQRKLRYRRLHFKESNEVPILLNKAIGLISSLAQVYANSLSLIGDDWDKSTTEMTPSTLGDSLDTLPKQYYLNPVDESLFIAQNVLAIYYIQNKKWQKSMRLLQTNLVRMDKVMPDGNLEYFANSKRSIAKTIKLTTLKCLLFVLHMLEPNVKQCELFGRIQALDRYSRECAEPTEADMIRMCQNCLLGIC